MVVQNDNTPEIFWVGAPLKNVKEPSLGEEDVEFFRKCIFGHLSIQIGDFVLISNADSPDPDSVLGCDVARIIHLYEVCDEFSKKDPCRAIVQWYSRPYDVPAKLFDDSICIDFDIEVIEDFRPFDQNVSIETIFSKCYVVSGKPEDSAIKLLQKHKKASPMFVCRYKCIRVKNKYKLIPLEVAEAPADAQRKKATSSLKNTPNKTPAKTPRSSRKTKGNFTNSPEPKTKSSKKEKFPEIEFVDVNALRDNEMQNLVSPIKIVKNTVIRMSRSGSEYPTTLSGKKEVNANYLTESPVATASRSATPIHKVSAARRNLNISLECEGNATGDSHILNYSIIKDTPDEAQSNEMKIKLRVSERQRSSRSEDPEIQKSPPARRTRRSSSAESVEIARGVLTRKRSQCEDPLESKKLKTPLKNVNENSFEKTQSTKTIDIQRRKSILKTPGDRPSLGGVDTPKRNIKLSNIVEELIYYEDSTLTPSKKGTPRLRKQVEDEDFVYESTPRKRKSVTKIQPSPSHAATPSKRPRGKTDDLTPSIGKREKSLQGRKSELEKARELLHVSAIPESLPCRETEFQNIHSFLEGKIQDKCGGCMYVSGVPGTGKTATVTGVIRRLQREAELERINEFDFIEINGMKLTEPRQAYVQIYKQLTGKTVSWEHAHSLLEKRFTTSAPRRTTTVLLVDELDILCNRRQDVVYNLLDWPTKAPARLVVITIANTMDLPERLLMGKVTSRLGLTRLTFQPYSHKQLQEIVTARLAGFSGFKNDAVQLVARKVAAVSGDARRALDICRRATEIAEDSLSEKDIGCVNMQHVSQALAEMIASAKVQAIKKCSRLEQIFLEAVAAEVTRTGVEETNFLGVYCQLEAITAFMGILTPTPGQALRICSRLGAERLLICEHSRNDIYQKILLNVSTDDIHYALQVKEN